MNNLLTTRLAAERLGISTRRVRALINAQRLPATKLGVEWLIDEADLALVAERKPGRAPGVVRTSLTNKQQSHEEDRSSSSK